MQTMGHLAFEHVASLVKTGQTLDIIVTKIQSTKLCKSEHYEDQGVVLQRLEDLFVLGWITWRSLFPLLLEYNIHHHYVRINPLFLLHTLIEKSNFVNSRTEQQPYLQPSYTIMLLH